MNKLNHNLEDLPVLTEIARSEAVTLASPVLADIDLRLALSESDSGGYDPYNSAPPVPQKTAWPA